MLVDGTVFVRAGSVDYVSLQLFQEDGTTPISLVGIIRAILRMKSNNKDDSTKSFQSDGVSPQIVFTDEINGKLDYRPVANDFTIKGTWIYYVDIIDSLGSHPVPEHKNYAWNVLDKIS